MREHLLVFGAVAVVAWATATFLFVCYQPRIFFTGVRRVLLRGMGIEAGGIPVNTLYTTPILNSPALAKSDLILTGNRDTLYTGGALDLAPGPLVVHVPDMAGRYYSIELFDSWLGVFGVIGRRTTGTRAGDFLIAGPNWSGAVPAGMTKMVSPSDSVLLLGRVLVEGEGDVATARDLAKRIQMAPLARAAP